MQKSREPHLRLADPVVLDGRATSPPVRERARGQDADDAADEEGEIRVAHRAGAEAVGGGAEEAGLG